MPPDHQEWTDLEMLEALDMFERQRLSATQIGARFKRSRNSVLGMIRRVRVESDREPDLAISPACRDGGMPPRWWAEGRQVGDAGGKC